MVVDPEADAEEAKRLYGITFGTMEAVKDMDAVIIAVAHKQFMEFTKDKVSSFYDAGHAQKVLMDIKGVLNRQDYMTEDFLYWRL